MIMGVPSRERDGDTAGPLLPGTPRDLEARATGRTTIEITWEYPEITDDGCDQDATAADDNEREDDGSECGDSVIMHYQVQVSDSATGPWTDLAMDVCRTLDDDGKPTKTMEDPCTYTHEGLMPDTTKHYRVYAVNAAGNGPVSNTDVDTTKLSEFPDVPGGLVGEAYGATAVKLCWLAQSLDPADDPVHSYQIVVSGMDDPVMVTANADGVVPTQTTIMGLSPDTEYTFTVRAVNNRGATNESATETVKTPDATVPDAPTGVTATANSDTQITVNWTAPADPDGAPVTGYIVERRYTDDMMGDIPSDGYNDAVMGASFAFSNHMEWWETLNCKGMLAAAGSDADHTMDSDDKAMYCAHYADTEPTDMAGTIMAGDATDMAIEELFDKRYIMDYRTDATARMHTDMGLMPETEYTYRVSAVNGKGRSPWSTADSATTMAADTSLGAPTMVEATVDGNTVTITWVDGANAGQHGAVLVRLDGTYENDWLSRHETDGELVLTNIPTGTYLAIVASISDDFSDMKFGEADVEVR